MYLGRMLEAYKMQSRKLFKLFYYPQNIHKYLMNGSNQGQACSSMALLGLEKLFLVNALRINVKWVLLVSKDLSY